MPPTRRYWRRGVPVAERGPGHSYRPDARPPSIVGAHQPGIATPQLDHVCFAAFDVTAARLAELRALLAAWSAEAERLMTSTKPLTLTSGADRTSGTGLRGLEDRLAVVGGVLELESPPGGGTRLRARVPLGAGAPAGDLDAER